MPWNNAGQEAEPEFRHVVVTCNEQGSLARDSRLA